MRARYFIILLYIRKKLPWLKTDNFGYAALPHPQNHHPRSETFSMFMPETQLLKKPIRLKTIQSYLGAFGRRVSVCPPQVIRLERKRKNMISQDKLL